jgi:hypothetical protein
MLEGFTDYNLLTLDMKNPKKPKMVGRYWLQG